MPELDHILPKLPNTKFDWIIRIVGDWAVYVRSRLDHRGLSGNVIAIINAMQTQPLKIASRYPYANKHVAYFIVFAICGVFASVGCNHSNPYLATQPGGYSPLTQPNGIASTNGSLWQNSLTGNNAANMNMQAATVAQIQELERRARLLDENNRQLTSQIAQVQQQTDLHRERADLLQTQLQDAAKQLEQARIANQRSQQDILAARSEVNGLQSSMRSRGGATLVANSSLQKTADAISASGIPATVDGKTIRISIPADQLLQPGTGSLIPQGNATLDKLASSLALYGGRNRIGVEAHTDSGPNAGMSMYQLASAQAAAVMDYLQRKNQLAPNQLFSVSHGPNHPVADNTSVTGRAQNRRIEIVIYPDTI